MIFDRDRFRCVYCGASPTDGPDVVLTVDHVLPVRHGGADRADNLVTCCLNCNSQKQDRFADVETVERFTTLARERNAIAGIADYQIIDLGNTSAQRRSRREWDILTYMTIKALTKMIWDDPANFALSRSDTILDILCLTLRSMTEYTRITGDLESANEARALLRRMVIDLMAAPARSHGKEPDRDALDEIISSRLEAPDADRVAASLGARGIADLLDMFVLTGRANPNDIKLFGGELGEAARFDPLALARIWEEESAYRRSRERKANTDAPPQADL